MNADDQNAGLEQIAESAGALAPSASDEPALWYALYTMPQCEKRIAKFLAKRKIDYYLPLIQKKRRWSDRIKVIEFPLFPGYIFLHMPFYQRRLDVLMHPSALRFVIREGRPAVIRDEDMESLRILVAGAVDLQAHPEENLPPGQPVIVRSGPFKGVRGIVASVKNKTRLFIKLEACSLCASTEFDIIDVEKIAP